MPVFSEPLLERCDARKPAQAVYRYRGVDVVDLKNRELRLPPRRAELFLGPYVVSALGRTYDDEREHESCNWRGAASQDGVDLNSRDDGRTCRLQRPRIRGPTR